MGKFTLTNLKTDKVRTYEAEDVKKAIIDMRFKLDLGTFEDAELQSEYEKTGLEVYRFDVVEEPPAPGEDLRQDFEDFITALDALNDMAQQMWDAGMNEKACLTDAQIYESSRKILGEAHPGTLKAMHNYALGLAKTGRNEESAEILNKYVDIIEKIKSENQ